MSARDKLDTYERDWERHLRWRMPPSHVGGAVPGRYVDKGSVGGRHEPAVTFREIPSDIEARVSKRLEAVVAALVAEEHAKVLSELRQSAREEAAATLAELGAPIGAAEAQYIETGVAP